MENEMLKLQSSESFIGPNDFEFNYIIRNNNEYKDKYEICIYKIGIGKKVLNKREDLQLNKVDKKLVDTAIERIIKIENEISEQLLDGPNNILTININNRTYKYYWSVLIPEYSFIDDLINEIFGI